MKTIGHLEQFDVTLTALGPVFVGCGKKFTKKEYVFLPGRSSTVLLPKEADFFRYLVEHNLVDQYETYILGAGTSSLYDFLKRDCRLTDVQIRQLCPYELRAEEALDASHSLKEINAFIRDPYGRVFVPGSSLKGALRTILLAEKVMDENKDRPLPFTDRKNGFPEWEYFHSLQLNTRRREDAVNSILRGVQISDSEPIADEDMMLAGKSDFSVDGAEKKINLCRECIRPGARIRFRLTLDHSVLKGAITAESIRNAIMRFDDYYLDQYLSCFASPLSMPDIDFSQVLFLGGGAGYFSKTVSYPYCGKMGLSEVCRQMQGQFRNHYHHLDEQRGISPHTMKYALYRGLYYPYGLCKVELT